MTGVKKHLDIASVPVFCKAHVTINLEKESLVLIILLVNVSCIEGIFSFAVLNNSHQNFRRVGKVYYSVDCFFGCI